MSNVIFQYDQDSASKLRDSFGITESGAYTGLLGAKYVYGSNGSKSAGIEFSLECQEGKLQYMSVYYQKRDGSVSTSGYNMIHAIMGLLKIKTLTSQQAGEDWICPELNGKQLGFVAQKILYNKNDSAMTEAYKFEPVMPFSATTRKTIKEALSNSPASAVDKMLPLLKTKDERKKGQQQAAGYHQHDEVHSYPLVTDDDDAPF